MSLDTSEYTNNKIEVTCSAVTILSPDFTMAQYQSQMSLT